jgi:predicted NBD/HSP70 family sugar kinase
MRLIEQETIAIQNVTGERLITCLVSLIETIQQNVTRPLLGITVGIPGIINSGTGFVHLTTYFDWHDVPLGAILTERFQLPVYVGNDSNLAAVGEYRYGHGQDVKNLVVVEAGEGLGAGILADGRIIGGHSLAAGEIGHMPVHPLNDICICGRRGCLETMVSWWGIKRHAQAIIQNFPDSPLAQLTSTGCEISISTIKSALAQGDQQLEELVQQVATYLGRALIMLIHLINPQMIIVTGSILELGDAFVEEVRKTVNEHTHPYTVGDLEIIANRFDNQSILLGAGAFLLEQELGL